MVRNNFTTLNMTAVFHSFNSFKLRDLPFDNVFSDCNFPLNKFWLLLFCAFISETIQNGVNFRLQLLSVLERFIQCILLNIIDLFLTIRTFLFV